ncbi:MAG TPA: hypothetical protein IAD19_00820 [Candidatus Egerieicola faecale]|uniref:ABC-transporter type IV n=1 Tax=Candidatus Egerieicola faecale TaxID=2840774 RepID=A0A9D1INS1_9FIRM|nr:hypothetical protein [Candidatus Egerieicola faecale]
MQKLKEQLTVFATGAAGYPVIELIWRQSTHWSMALAGGTCLLLLYNLYGKFTKLSLGMKCVLGSGVITAVEFVAGLLVNCWQDWNVWDYSCFKFHFMGQICLVYSVLWGLLCLPMSGLCKIMRKRLHGEPTKLLKSKKALG